VHVVTPALALGQHAYGAQATTIDAGTLATAFRRGLVDTRDLGVPGRWGAPYGDLAHHVLPQPSHWDDYEFARWGSRWRGVDVGVEDAEYHANHWTSALDDDRWYRLSGGGLTSGSHDGSVYHHYGEDAYLDDDADAPPLLLGDEDLTSPDLPAHFPLAAEEHLAGGVQDAPPDAEDHLAGGVQDASQDASLDHPAGGVWEMVRGWSPEALVDPGAVEAVGVAELLELCRRVQHWIHGALDGQIGPTVADLFDKHVRSVASCEGLTVAQCLDAEAAKLGKEHRALKRGKAKLKPDSPALGLVWLTRFMGCFGELFQRAANPDAMLCAAEAFDHRLKPGFDWIAQKASNMAIRSPLQKAWARALEATSPVDKMEMIAAARVLLPVADELLLGLQARGLDNSQAEALTTTEIQRRRGALLS
jgi:hypothetical protein